MLGAGVWRALGLARDADARRALRQADDPLAADDRLHLLEARLVVGEDRVAHDLLLLELADHVAVVGDGEALLARDERRERLHLVADLHEGDARALDELRRGDVDAHLLQPVRVDFLGQPEVLAAARQHLGLQEVVVRRHLSLEPCVRLLPAGDLELLEQLRDAVDVEGAVADVLLDGGLHRALQPGDTEPLADAVARELEHRHVARLEPGVALEARERGRAPLRGHLLVEQPADPEEDHLHRVEVGDLQLVGEVVAGDVVARGVDEDLEVLAHRGIALGREPLLEVRERGLELLLDALLAARLEVEDLLVEALDSELARALRAEAGEHVDENLRVGVALRDPGGPRGTPPAPAGGGVRPATRSASVETANRDQGFMKGPRSRGSSRAATGRDCTTDGVGACGFQGIGRLDARASGK